mgnify:FL=1
MTKLGKTIPILICGLNFDIFDFRLVRSTIAFPSEDYSYPLNRQVLKKLYELAF